MIVYDYDSGEGSFSMLQYGLAAGTQYYLKFRGFANNSASARLVVAGLPDMIVMNIASSPASPVQGNAVTFSATIKNQGTAATV